MQDGKAFDPNENEVERPSYFLLRVKPWQALHHAIDEKLGLVLLSTTELQRSKNEILAIEQKDFDAKGVGLEVSILFVSRGDHGAVSFESWCDPSATPETTWEMMIERIDGKQTCGRVRAFERHQDGIVAHVRLEADDRMNPPKISHARHGIAKVYVRYGQERKTHKTAHAKPRKQAAPI